MYCVYVGKLAHKPSAGPSRAEAEGKGRLPLSICQLGSKNAVVEN